MNNTDFRRFVLDTPRQRQDGSPDGFAKPSAPASTLGSKSKSNIPMTPRTVKGTPSVDFARQAAEQKAASQPNKKFRSSAAPKGSKFSEGYTDRSAIRARAEEDDASAQDEREERVRALEEQMKLGQIDAATFEQLRDSITGGDIGATHLVKGLDRQLLARVRKGEDVLSGAKAKSTNEAAEHGASPEINADEEFEKLEQQQVAPKAHEKVNKKGQMAPPPKPVAGVKRSRNEILAELKASRKAAQEASQQSQLGARFKKFRDQGAQPGPRLERDEKGREVLITVDEHGRMKRKVRKVAQEDNKGLLMPDQNAKPLGMEVPQSREPVPQNSKDGPLDDSDDIFEGVGANFDPLGALKGAGGADNDDDDSASSSVSEGEYEGEDETTIPPPPLTARGDITVAAEPPAPSKEPPAPSKEPPAPSKEPPAPSKEPPASSANLKHNYFNDTGSTNARSPSVDDSALRDVIKRAAAIAERRPLDDHDVPTGSGRSSDTAGDGNDARLQRLLQRDRDLEDIDMGFGGSRFDDAEEDDDGGGARVKLSEWKGAGDDDEDDDAGGARGGKGQRKRGKKKRKGDKESAADVLRVMEGRRK